jgi:hypothetical protein
VEDGGHGESRVGNRDEVASAWEEGDDALRVAGEVPSLEVDLGGEARKEGEMHWLGGLGDPMFKVGC